MLPNIKKVHTTNLLRCADFGVIYSCYLLSLLDSFILFYLFIYVLHLFNDVYFHFFPPTPHSNHCVSLVTIKWLLI